MKKIIIWYNPNKHIYYYKISYDFFDKFKVGFKNQYNHSVILVIDIYKEILYREPLKNKVINRLIRFLQNIKSK